MSLSLLLAASLVVLLCYTLWTVLKTDSARAKKRGNDASGTLLSSDAVTDADVAEQAAVQESFEFTLDSDLRSERILILYGTEYGFSKDVARRTAQTIAARLPTVAARVLNMQQFYLVDFEREQVLLVCCSTTGDGVVPSEAQGFHDALQHYAGGDAQKYDEASTSSENSEEHPTLRLPPNGIAFSVLALGDEGYPHFCRGGKLFDEALHRVSGGDAMVPRQDVDQEESTDIEAWIEAVVAALESRQLQEDSSEDYLLERVKAHARRRYVEANATGAEVKYSLKRPYWAPLIKREPLTTVDGEDDKRTLRIEFDVADSGMRYQCGDALGVVVQNDSEEVDVLISALDWDEKELVTMSGGDDSRREERPLREVLLRLADLKSIKPELLRAVLSSVKSDEDRERARSLMRCDDVFELDAAALRRLPAFSSVILPSYFVSDLLAALPSAKPAPRDIMPHLRTLIPRFYSIASSPQVEPERITLALADVQYSLHRRVRRGVASSFLDRMCVNDAVAVYVQPNAHFRLPEDASRSIIMIGAGTGVAPYRGFLQERQQTNATGKNVLFFGCRHRDRDWLFGEEMRQWESEGVLQLFCAFSRDQQAKRYVQHRIREQAALVWAMLQDGTHVYVCGDATHMAPDVHTSLLDVLEGEAHMDAAEAQRYMQRLSLEQRYQRDVWVT